MGQQVTSTKKGSAVIVWKHLLWFRNVSNPYSNVSLYKLEIRTLRCITFHMPNSPLE